MLYSLDGSNPQDGTQYQDAFEIGAGAALLLVYARSGEATKTTSFSIPHSSDKTAQIDDTEPATINTGKAIALDTTDRVYGVINRFREQPKTRFKGIRIEIGEGENTVTVRFQERQITAATIKGTIDSLLKVLQEDDALVAINIAGDIHFENGFAAKEFAALAGIRLRPGDVRQEG